MNWRIWDTGIASAEANMALDQKFILDPPDSSDAVLHFYDWDQESATYGYFTDPYLYLNEDIIKKRCLQLARRPTGGGILFHGLDLTFSIWIPVSHPSFSVNTLQNYQFINQIVTKAILDFSKGSLQPVLLSAETDTSEKCLKNFCMAKPTLYDVMIEGRKVGGGAQRRTKKGFLHQGSILLTMPSEERLRELFLPGTTIVDSMIQNSYSLLGISTLTQLANAKEQLRHSLMTVISRP